MDTKHFKMISKHRNQQKYKFRHKGKSQKNQKNTLTLYSSNVPFSIAQKYIIWIIYKT